MVPDHFCPLISLYFGVGHESVANPGTEDLKGLFLVTYPLDGDYIMDVDEAFWGALEGGLFVLVELHDDTVVSLSPEDVPSLPVLCVCACVL